MSHPEIIFVLSDGSDEGQVRYYLTSQEAAKALAALYGWSGTPSRPRFGRFTVMFHDGPQLDLTRVVRPHIDQIHQALADIGMQKPYLPRYYEWRNREADQKTFDRRRGQVRRELRAVIEAAVEDRLANPAPDAHADYVRFRNRVRDDVVAAVTNELDRHV